MQEERRFYKALRLYYISNANVKSGTSAVHETSAWIQELNEYVYVWVYARTFPEATAALWRLLEKRRSRHPHAKAVTIINKARSIDYSCSIKPS